MNSKDYALVFTEEKMIQVFIETVGKKCGKEVLSYASFSEFSYVISDCLPKFIFISEQLMSADHAKEWLLEFDAAVAVVNYQLFIFSKLPPEPIVFDQWPSHWKYLHLPLELSTLKNIFA